MTAIVRLAIVVLALAAMPAGVGRAAERAVDEPCPLGSSAINTESADVLRDSDELIALLESEISDPDLSVSSEDFRIGLRSRLAAARALRAETVANPQDNPDVSRDRCHQSMPVATRR